MPDPQDRRTDGAPPSHVHVETKRTNWLAWLALLLGVLALLFALSRCDRHEEVVTTTNTTTTSSEVIGATPGADRSTVLAGTAGLGAFLAGSEAAPRSFAFERLNFDTGSSTVRPQDGNEIAAVATTLQQYPNARIRIAGYADARGSDAANVALGNARAASVKAALVGRGIDAARIATGTGGESDPVDSNATASGQAENRRTELVVTQR